MLALLAQVRGVGANPLRLSLAPAQSSCAMGESPVFKLKVENLTRQKVKFTYFRPAFFYPSFSSVKGQTQVQGEVYDGPAQPVVVVVQPGQKYELPAATFRLVPQIVPGNQAQWLTTPGLYKAHFRVVLFGERNVQWELHSNSVKLLVTPKAAP